MISKETEYKYARENVVELLEDFKNRLLNTEESYSFTFKRAIMINFLLSATYSDINLYGHLKTGLQVLNLNKIDYEKIKRFYENNEVQYWILINDFKNKSEHFKTIKKIEDF